MVQLHSVAAGLPVVRPTNDVDVLLHVETGGGRASEVAGALERLGYRLRPSIDARTGTAHRFVRDGAVVDLVTSATDRSVVDMVAADRAPPRTLERFRGYDLVQVAGGPRRCGGPCGPSWGSPERRGRRSACLTPSAP
ncbi:MAG: hypothetical protein M3Q22_11770 [Actinomycetota bacterium]|nr:hypothetical protein [Actinomycetota bacterium]